MDGRELRKPGVAPGEAVREVAGTMKTATVEDLSHRAADLLRWVEAGEEVAISRLGAVVARLVPVTPEEPAGRVDWTQSAAVLRDRTGERVLSAEESLALIKEAGGGY